MKAALGKGLNALIPEKGEEISYLDVDRIMPGKQQPRRVFHEESLKELAASIKERGVLQPVIVSRTGDGAFNLIAGERRWRASILAGLKKIPALIKNVASKDSLEIALIENIQREDLNPIETAEAFNRLVKDFELTQEDLAARVGKERATVANYLRLLKLPEEIKTMLYNGSLSMGHARALLSIEGRTRQVEAARKIIKSSLSVRETEVMARNISKPLKGGEKIQIDPQIASLEEKLIKHLGTKVHIVHKGKKGGKIEIEYFSLDEFDRLFEILMAG
ncbi:MAG TPA: ParB/RepB/Spo0J family partition protein [Candidatus Sulfobium mesophilum]|nr:ParB/RepB/Spo0J family partition protein [Candidatus Sulfobium mesophilum]